MATRHENPEYSAIKKHYMALVEAVTRGNIPCALFQDELISDDAFYATGTTKDKGKAILRDVLEAVRLNPAMFQNFCDSLTHEKVVQDILEAVKDTLKELKENPEQQGSEEYQKLKDQLEVFKSTLDAASSPNVELSAINCIQDLIRQYIEKALKSGIEVGRVKADMDMLCRIHFVVPTALWTWAMQEVEQTNEKLTVELRKVSKLVPVAKEASPKPSLFCKDTLYHASLCCDAINLPSSASGHTYFQNRNPQHDLTEVSFSQSRDNITPYMIAKQQDVIYVAFQSTPFLSKWMKAATSFDEGLKQQSRQIPLRFFIEELNKHKKIVLTGFSFGGMLACCVGARLWGSTTDREILLERVVCITFGQPFLQIRMVQEEIQICPQFEQTIHSVFCKDDFVPVMLGYVDESNLSSLPVLQPPKAKALVGPSNKEIAPRCSAQDQTQPGDLFSVPYVKAFLQNLAILQGYHLLESKSYSKAHSLPPVLHKKVPDAIKWLSEALLNVSVYREQTTSILYGNCYVMSKIKEKGITWQHQAKQLASIELSHHTRLVANQLDEKLFQQHTMESYMKLTFRSHLETQPDKYTVPNVGQALKEVAEVGVLKPKITASEVHEYPNEYVIVLQGENLWFSYKVCLDEKGSNECEIDTPAESTTKFMIEFHVIDSHSASSALQESKQVKIALYTHFANPIRHTVETRKEPHAFSARQIQLAKHTPTQVIQLAYLCALLEQQGQQSQSKRFKAIGYFLEEAIKVVPLESVFDAIAYGKRDIALDCAKALKKRDPQLQPSQLMIMGAIRAATRARTGYNGATIDRLSVPPVICTQQVIQCAFQLVPAIQQQAQDEYRNPKPLQQPHVQTEVQFEIQYEAQQQTQPCGPVQRQPRSQAQGKQQAHPPLQPMKRKGKEETKPMYSAVASGKSASSTTLSPAGSSFAQQMLQPTHLMPVPMPIPIFLDQRQHPPPNPFPCDITEYLESCVKALVQQKSTQEVLRFGTELTVVSKANINEVYSVSSRRRCAHFRSPLQILEEAMKKIAQYTEEARLETGQIPPPRTKLHNEQMLKLIDQIYSSDVAICASLLGAFMEQQIRIPLLNSAKATAEALSSRPAPVAVGVWALFSLSLGNLQEMLSSSNHSALIVEIKEYIEGISQQLPENEDRMYAGKLQFLLQGIKEIVTSSSQYISYSLEHQLCSNLKFDKTITLLKLIAQWDTIFANDALSLIAKSHRPLVARWLKWTILVHDLREVLAQYTCIGVTGLVNSGKSQLVKKLFGIEKVKVGTRAAKRTTVPLLYNLEGKVDGLDVIDFPGVDDSDHTVPELADLLLSLSQIIVFVVDYRKASSDPVKSWLRALSNNGVPVLVCLTHADVLYLECAADDRKEDIVKELVLIREELKLGAQNSPEIYFYSFCQIPSLQVSPDQDLKEFGIKSPVDVGDWLVQTLETKLKQAELARNLKAFIHS